MTALELYKYVTENKIEWHWNKNPDSKQDDVIIFPTPHEAGLLMAMLSHTILDEEGIECRMKQGYFAIWMGEICDHYGYELTDIFPQRG